MSLSHTSHLHLQPYQTSEYDRAIQQAAERERVAQAVRSLSSTPTLPSSSHDKLSPAPRLPGLNDLFASKLLINPSTGVDWAKSGHDDQRRDSAAAVDPLDSSRTNSFSQRSNPPPPLVLNSKSSAVSIQNLCSPLETTLPSPPASLNTSPTARQYSRSSLIQPASHSQPTSPYELPPGFFGTSDLAPATYVYQAASSYEGISYVPGRGPCHMYKGGYSIPTHIFQDPLNITQSKILRKRLSVACSTCRKKKIKCEPGPDGCLQCKKAQRTCKIEPAKRRLKSTAGTGVHHEQGPA